MRLRQVGRRWVSAVGLGAMPLSIEGRPDEARAMATVRAAVDAGVTLIDTADSYHWHAGEAGHNEQLVAKALTGVTGVLVATKGGRGRPGDGSWTVNGRPDHLIRACEASLRRLGTDRIGLYQLHKPDPAVPWVDSVGALRTLLDAGKVEAVGLSNVTCAQVEEAREILGADLVSVQNRFSPAAREHAPVLALCTRLGLAFLPWSPLGGLSRSSLDGHSPLDEAHPRFAAVAGARGVSPQRVGLAWLLALSPVVVPIPGASRPESIRDSAAAADLTLDVSELEFLSYGRDTPVGGSDEGGAEPRLASCGRPR
ncbi:aldo/keto reductase [Actinoplanes sp. NEAU-A12]|uniref:Aldo/keto reductase n=1 Tax=Actinoplanes sandaracinus TaxID=3045177 RepID=A0ABT6WSV9_9ACTN|nr:aldo/keto reductase [Actinoplanes sandaracinus]MDI6102795.1 aldo/keto reductase [Actinoplanes sandaracinus]